MFGVKPKKVIRAPDGKGSPRTVEDFWEPAKKSLFGDLNLLGKLLNYDKDNIDMEVIKKVLPFEALDAFRPDAVSKASVAAAGM